MVNDLIHHLILTPRFNLQLTHHINRTKSIAKTIDGDSKQLLQNAKKLSQLQQASKLSDQIFNKIIKKADKDLHNNYLNYLHDLIGGRKKPHLLTKPNKPHNSTSKQDSTTDTLPSTNPNTAGRTTPITDNTHKQTLADDIQRCELALNKAKDEFMKLTATNKRASAQQSRPQINDHRSFKDKLKPRYGDDPYSHNDRPYHNANYDRNDHGRYDPNEPNPFTRGTRPYRGRPYKRYRGNDRHRRYDNHHERHYDTKDYHNEHTRQTHNHPDKPKDPPRQPSKDTPKDNQSPQSNWGKPPTNNSANANSNYGWGQPSQPSPQTTGWGTPRDSQTWETPQRNTDTSIHSPSQSSSHTSVQKGATTPESPAEQPTMHKRHRASPHKRRSASTDYRSDQQRHKSHGKHQTNTSHSSNRRKHPSKRKRSPSPSLSHSSTSDDSDPNNYSPSPSPDTKPKQSKRHHKHQNKKHYR